MHAVDLTDGPQVIILFAAVLVAVGVIWQKLVVPVRNWVRRFKKWMDRTESALTWVETQMKPNGGSSLVDKVNLLLAHDAERDAPNKRYGPHIEGTPNDLQP